MTYERLTQRSTAYVNYHHFTLESVGRHHRSRDEFETYAILAVRRAVEQGEHAIAELGDYLLKWASHPKLLRNVWGRLARFGGPAPGPNGRRYGDLTNDEVWDLLKAVSTSIQAGSYEPEPASQIWVPKDPLDPSRGTRPISLINTEDRVIQRGMVELLSPLRDPFLEDLVFGSRPRRNRLHALAQLEQMAVQSKRWVWIAEDIRDCFENVRRSRLRDVLLQRIPGQELVELIMRLIDNGRRHGIQQGGPLSPFVLNEFVDHFLDKVWKQIAPDIPVLRYVDDLLPLCRTKKEAGVAWSTLQETLRLAGMQLKEQNPIRDLRKGETVEWLGFSIGRGDDRLRVQIAAKSWSRLYGKLVLAHEKPNAPVRATEAINSARATSSRVGLPCWTASSRWPQIRALMRFPAGGHSASVGGEPTSNGWTFARM